MKNRIFSLFLVLTMIFATASTAMASVTGSYEEASNEVTITGQLSANKAGSFVTMMLLALDGDDVKDIEYVKKAVVAEDGTYEFNFKVTDKKNSELEKYTLRVNEAGEDVTNTVLDIIADPNRIDITNPDNVLPVADAKIKADNQRVYVKGNIGAEYYGEMVSLMLIYPKGNQDTKIGYVDITTVDADGNYEFKFKFTPPTGNLEDYYVRINKAGQEVSNTLVEAISSNEKLYTIEAKLTETGVTAKYDTVYSGNYGIDPSVVTSSNYVQILAFYDKDSRLTGLKKQNIDSDVIYTTSGDEITVSLSDDVPENTAFVKGFLWENITTIIPVLGAEKVKAGERIVCWGDSLTYGSGGGEPADVTGGVAVRYPDVLAELTGKTIVNYGIGGDSAVTIASRQGGVKMLLDEALNIPAETESTEVKIKSELGIELNLLRNDLQGSRGVNPVTINGVEGKISRVDTTEDDVTTTKYYFTRSEAGEAVTAAADSVVLPASMTNGSREDLNIIFIGQNGGYPNSNVEGLMSVIDKMIANLNSDRYVVVGLTTSQRRAYEPIMQRKYGAKYINMREWLASNEAIESIGLTNKLSDEDKSSILAGNVPSILRADDVHLNSYGYRLFANKIYEKLQELSYID